MLDPPLAGGVSEARDVLVGAGQGVGALGAAAPVLARHAALARDRGTRGPSSLALTRAAAVTPPGPVREPLAVQDTFCKHVCCLEIEMHYSYDYAEQSSPAQLHHTALTRFALALQLLSAIMEILNTCRAGLLVLTETCVASRSIETRGGAVTRVGPRLALVLVLTRGHAGHGVVVAPVTSRTCAVEPAHPEHHHHHYSRA